ncbi:MAG: hypothetical protein LBJ77_04080 [Holosporales bacterium]|jgi:hypothetical protein|nr:hypothetical protein [Holosporales bacterium]
MKILQKANLIGIVWLVTNLNASLATESGLYYMSITNQNLYKVQISESGIKALQKISPDQTQFNLPATTYARFFEGHGWVTNALNGLFWTHISASQLTSMSQTTSILILSNLIPTNSLKLAEESAPLSSIGVLSYEDMPILPPYFTSNSPFLVNENQEEHKLIQTISYNEAGNSVDSMVELIPAHGPGNNYARWTNKGATGPPAQVKLRGPTLHQNPRPLLT